MAKIPFSKLGVKIENEISVFSWGEYEIEVKKYLPMDGKSVLVSNVLNYSADENGYYNPLQIKVFLTLETVYAYTNITFTEKQKENVLKLYDAIISSGLFEKIIQAIPVNEWRELQDTVHHMISNIYEYKNSAMGILDAISSDYSNLNLDVEALTNTLLNNDSLTTLKELVPLVQ